MSTADWANLTNTIRGGAQDFSNTALGIARYLDESRLNDLKYREGSLRLKELEETSKIADMPVNMANIIGETVGNEPLTSKIEYVKNINNSLSAFGFKMNADYTLSDKDGKPVSRRMFKQFAPALQGAVLASANPTVLAQGEFEKLLQMREAVKNDPQKLQLVDKQIAIAKSNLETIDSPTEWTLNLRKNALVNARGQFEALGADAKFLDTQVAEVDKNLDKIAGIEIEKRSWVKLPDSVAQMIGVPKGTSYPKDVVQSAIPAYIHYKSATAAAGIAAGAQRENMNFNAFLTQYEKAIEGTASAVINSMKDINGDVNIMLEDGTQRKATPQEIEKIYLAARESGAKSYLKQLGTAGGYSAKFAEKFGVQGMNNPGASTPVPNLAPADITAIKIKMGDIQTLAATLSKTDKASISSEVAALNAQIKGGKLSVIEIGKKLDSISSRYKKSTRPTEGLNRIKDASTPNVDQWIGGVENLY